MAMKRKIAAIMAADVVGYSRLVAENEARALEHLLACRQIFAEFVERGGGRIFNTAGDAVLAEFPSAVEALLAGIDIQDCLRTHYAGQPDGFRMQFRMGMTIGDVVERDGDLLGDGVNVAARLEGLAQPGGICISGIMHEQVLNKVSARFRDIGMKTVKNIPAPIHVYALDGLLSGPVTTFRTSRRRLKLAAMALFACVIVVLGSAIGLGLRWSRAANHSMEIPIVSEGVQSRSAITTSDSGIYGVVQHPAIPSVASDASRLFNPAETPFVSDSERLTISGVLSKHGPNSALALSDNGGFGLVSDRSSPETARKDAMDLCSASGRGECELYEVNDVITWPRPIPLPPKPWIDDKVARTPFDVARLKGLSDVQMNLIAQKYPSASYNKSLTMGASGWWWRSRRGDEDEAIRVGLELCGNREGVACRVVAVNDQFVVDNTRGPVETSVDAVDRCDKLAGAPYDVGLSNGRVSFAEIDAMSALSACRQALALHPYDASLQLSLGRAVEKSGLMPEKALDLYKSAAEAGDAAAMNVLGMAYDAGKLGLSRDASSAVNLYRKAAEAGNPDGIRNLGLMYAAGRGVPRDRDESARLFAQAERAEALWQPKSR